jgi:hypothetical protein
MAMISFGGWFERMYLLHLKEMARFIKAPQHDERGHVARKQQVMDERGR